MRFVADLRSTPQFLWKLAEPLIVTKQKLCNYREAAHTVCITLWFVVTGNYMLSDSVAGKLFWKSLSDKINILTYEFIRPIFCQNFSLALFAATVLLFAVFFIFFIARFINLLLLTDVTTMQSVHFVWKKNQMTNKGPLLWERTQNVEPGLTKKVDDHFNDTHYRSLWF